MARANTASVKGDTDVHTRRTPASPPSPPGISRGLPLAYYHPRWPGALNSHTVTVCPPCRGAARVKPKVQGWGLVVAGGMWSFTEMYREGASGRGPEEDSGTAGTQKGTASDTLSPGEGGGEIPEGETPPPPPRRPCLVSLLTHY